MGIINRLLRRFGRSQSDAMLTGEEAHGITSEIGMRPTPERQQQHWAGTAAGVSRKQSGYWYGTCWIRRRRTG